MRKCVMQGEERFPMRIFCKNNHSNPQKWIVVNLQNFYEKLHIGHFDHFGNCVNYNIKLNELIN